MQILVMICFFSVLMKSKNILVGMYSMCNIFTHVNYKIFIMYHSWFFQCKEVFLFKIFCLHYSIIFHTHCLKVMHSINIFMRFM